MGTSTGHAALHPGVRRTPYFSETEREGVSEYMVYNHTYMAADYGRGLADYTALTTDVALWDVGAERQTQLKGPDAVRFADYLVTSRVGDFTAGRCKYTYCCDETGRVICDPVLLVPADDTVWLSHGNVDLLLWVKGIALHSSFDVVVDEPDIAPMQVQGPKSRDLLREVIGASIDDLGYYRCMTVAIAGTDVVVSRTGWSGGLGYEIYPLDSAGALGVWRAVAEAGEAFGLLVTGPNVARAIECGITDTTFYSGLGANALEMGRSHLVDLDKDQYMGRDALRAIAKAGPARATVGLLGPPERLPRGEDVWTIERGGAQVGRLRWVTFSPALQRAIAIAVIDTPSSAVGTEVTVVYPGGSAAMTVTTLPFVDKDPT